MDEDAPVIYGLELQGRTLCPLYAESEAIRFLVGTQSLQTENQVHLLDFDDESNIINKHVFRHPDGEIWHINSSPTDKNILATCYSRISDEGKAQLHAAVWQMPPVDETEPPMQVSDDGSNNFQGLSLQKLTELDGLHGDVKNVLWNPSGDQSRLLTVSDRHIDVWNLKDMQNTQVSDSIPLEGKAQLKFTAGRFSPHHGGTQIAATIESTVRGWDLRSMRPTFEIAHAHNQTIRDLDFNPNKQYLMVTCSDDCKVKFWDTRNVSEPLVTRQDHSHWVWSVRYNHFHDQLVLTSSSDSRVILSSIASCSSEPYGHMDDDDDDDDNDNDGGDNKSGSPSRAPEPDHVICSFDEHEDSVYACAWSTADPWVFASLSYDGRLVFNKVPRAEKYKILL